MLEAAVARRYAAALFMLARDRGLEAALGTELQSIARAVGDYPELRRIVEHRLLPADDRLRALTAVLPGLSVPTVNFMRLVMRKRRERYLEAIYREYVRLRDEAAGVVEIEVRSAADVPPALLERLGTRLEKVAGRRVRLRVERDPAIVGGLRAQIGDTVIDGSLGARLRQLRRRLKGDTARS
jgi:F-type H+-transporting ATPase subunit delta